MKRTIQITASLAVAATLICAALKAAADWAVGIWVGAGWGIANIWALKRAVQAVIQGGSKWRLAGWIALKLIGLYGLAAVLLILLNVAPVAWLIGFGLSLFGMTIGSYSTVKTLFQPAKITAFLAASTAALMAAGVALAEEAFAAHGKGSVPSHPPEIPNLMTLIVQLSPDAPWAHFLQTWENTIYAFLIVGIVGGLVAWGARVLALRPGRTQMAAEIVVEGLDNLVCGVLGQKEGRRYLPFLGALFLFILSMNLAGLVPGLKSPTSRFEMTGALGLTVFVYVQSVGIRRLGLAGYLDHMIGQPRDPVGWILSPLMLFIHGIGELVKPLSLALRLFGNIMGEDTLLGVFVVLGALSFAWSHLPIGVPLHLPFVLLAIIFSVVQALVFTSLSMIYIYMMLPHEEQAHGAH